MPSNVSPLHYQIRLVIIQSPLNQKVKAEKLNKKALLQKEQESVTQLRQVDLFQQLGQIAVIHHHGQIPVLRDYQAYQQVLEDPLRLQAAKRRKKYHAMKLYFTMRTWSISLMSKFRFYDRTGY